MSDSAGYREVFRQAGQRWLDGDADALTEYEAGIGLALEQGDLEAAVAAHQRLLAWRPEDRVRHERVARVIAAASDRAQGASAASPAPGRGPIFPGVPQEELVSLLTTAAPVRVPAGETIVREGERGDSLFLIASGTVRVSTRGEQDEDVPLAVLGPGDFFGEVSLLTGRPRTATVVALTETDLLRFDRTAVDGLRRLHPRIETSLSEFHRRRAESTVEALLERRRK